MRCILCRGSQIDFIGRPQISPIVVELIKADHVVVECKTCEFYFVFPEIPFSISEWEILYADEYFGEMTKWFALKREKARFNVVLYVSVPNENCLLNTVKKIVYSLTGKQEISAHIKPFQGPFHIIGFTNKSLHRALEMSGFKVLELRNFAGEYQWRKHKVFTSQFFLEISLLPIHLIAIPLGKRLYLEAIAVK